MLTSLPLSQLYDLLYVLNTGGAFLLNTYFVATGSYFACH